MSVKCKESTQWYFFYVATAIATFVYSQKVTKNGDHFHFHDTLEGRKEGRLLKHSKLDNCNHV